MLRHPTLQLISFCESVQRRSPVGAHIRPVPGLTAGYGDHEVIFADGTFTEGSTLELSADGPLREPFAAYSQVELPIFFVVRDALRIPQNLTCAAERTFVVIFYNDIFYCVGNVCL